MSTNVFPNYLVAVDRKRNRVFVLAQPDVCALKIDGQWRTSAPLPDEEIPNYDLVIDPEQALHYVDEARNALFHKDN